MLAHYLSDGSVNRDGFEASFACEEPTVAPPSSPAPDSPFDPVHIREGEDTSALACSGGASVGHEASIAITQGYQPNANCSWLITCAAPPVVLTFFSMNVEESWDY